MDLRRHWSYIGRVARKRLANNKTSRHVSEYGTDIEVIGAAGEFAARLFFGISTRLHVKFDHGTDINWRGYTIDVKATRLTPRLHHRFLQWPAWKECKTDIVLMTAVDLRGKRAIIVGWAWGEDIKKARINHDRDYPCHEIPIPNLYPTWRLFVLRSKNARRKNNEGEVELSGQTSGND